MAQSLVAPPVPPPPAVPSIAQALVAPPLAPSQPAAVQPGEVKPGAAKAKPPPVKQAPTRRLEAGDLVCGNCGEGNDPARKFCSRCGMSLDTAQKVKTPWWRKIIRKRGPKTLAAGERPGKPGKGGAPKKKLPIAAVMGKMRLIISIILLVGGLLYAVSPPFRNAVYKRWSSTKTKVMQVIRPQFNPVRPSGINATSECCPLPDGKPTNPASAATDGFKNTAWAANAADLEPTLILSFERATNLDQVLITSGDPKEFVGLPRPQVIHLVYSNGKSQDITIKDEQKPQRITLKGATGVTQVEMHVTKFYKPAAPKGDTMRISEIELFTKK
jgi:hypothetical protein